MLLKIHGLHKKSCCFIVQTSSLRLTTNVHISHEKATNYPLKSAFSINCVKRTQAISAKTETACEQNSIASYATY